MARSLLIKKLDAAVFVKVDAQSIATCCVSRHTYLGGLWNAQAEGTLDVRAQLRDDVLLKAQLLPIARDEVRKIQFGLSELVLCHGRVQCDP